MHKNEKSLQPLGCAVLVPVLHPVREFVIRDDIIPQPHEHVSRGILLRCHLLLLLLWTVFRTGNVRGRIHWTQTPLFFCDRCRQVLLCIHILIVCSWYLISVLQSVLVSVIELFIGVIGPRVSRVGVASAAAFIAFVADNGCIFWQYDWSLLIDFVLLEAVNNFNAIVDAVTGLPSYERRGFMNRLGQVDFIHEIPIMSWVVPRNLIVVWILGLIPGLRVRRVPTIRCVGIRTGLLLGESLVTNQIARGMSDGWPRSQDVVGFKALHPQFNIILLLTESTQGSKIKNQVGKAVSLAKLLASLKCLILLNKLELQKLRTAQPLFGVFVEDMADELLELFRGFFVTGEADIVGHLNGTIITILYRSSCSYMSNGDLPINSS